MKTFKRFFSFLACTVLISSSFTLSAQIFQPNPQPSINERHSSRTTIEKIQLPDSQNLLKNSSFNEIGDYGESTNLTTGPSINGGSKGWYSAARHWTVWTNTYGNLTTQLLPSTLNRRSKMMKVTTNGAGNGLVQVFGKLHEGPQLVEACVWILVESGKVGVGVGDGGNTHISMVLENTGRWERIMVTNAVSPANEIIIYTTTPNAVFYVESATVRIRGEIMDYNCCSPE
ncbi:MAG: hypothetical protein R3E32_20915 [Chitinophagales bacterium]